MAVVLVEIVDEDARATSRLTTNLGVEIERLSVGIADPARQELPDGVKGNLSIGIEVTVASIPSFCTFLLGWLSRNRDIRVRVSVGDRMIDIPATTSPAEAEVLLRLLTIHDQGQD